jgi:hypothetical protein
MRQAQAVQEGILTLFQVYSTRNISKNSGPNFPLSLQDIRNNTGELEAQQTNLNVNALPTVVTSDHIAFDFFLSWLKENLY